MSNLINDQLHNELGKNELDIQELEKQITSCSDVNCVADDFDGKNILQEVIYTYGHDRDISQLIRVLIEKGADLNYQDWFGNTALHTAILSRSISSIKILLENSANPNLLSIEDLETALDYAQMEQLMTGREDTYMKLEDIIKLLLRHNAKPRKLLFNKSVDGFLLVSLRYNNLYPTGLVTSKGNIFVEDISNIDKEICYEIMYWLTNHPSDKLFEEKPEHPLVIKFYEKQDKFIKYFTEFFHGDILVGDGSLELSEKIYDKKKSLYEKERNGNSL